MHGWIILDKPSGITSAHAVAKVKRLLKPAKIGHAGTLDPLASGVLPLALGEATKTVAFMMDFSKEYGFTVTWGEERDTDDREGRVTATSDKRPTQEEILHILPKFTGKISQIPPDFSAIKIDGKRAYDTARKGLPVAITAREIEVHSLCIEEYQRDNTSFACTCGKGTYIRSLARDMGRELGCHGHIAALRRRRVGKFDEKAAISLENLEKMVHKDGLGFLRSVDSALDDIPAFEITDDQASRLKRGQGISSEGLETRVLARCRGTIVAIGERKSGIVKPLRVFNL